MTPMRGVGVMHQTYSVTCFNCGRRSVSVEDPDEVGKITRIEFETLDGLAVQKDLRVRMR